ncbi:hypothetical protein ACFL5U_03155 [Candidatus Margulisiibacteriota bacterium]
MTRSSRLTNAPHPDYLAAVQRHPSACQRLEVMSKKLPITLETTPAETTADHLVRVIQRNEPNLDSSDFDKAEISFPAPEHVKHITGVEIPIPTVTFPHASDYNSFTRKAGYFTPPQGLSLGIEGGSFCSALGISTTEALKEFSLRIVVYCQEQLSAAMPPAQTWQHEAVHCLDPLIDLRSGENYLIAEIIARIGEFAQPGTPDRSEVRTSSNVWLSHLMSHLMGGGRISLAFTSTFKLPLTLNPLSAAKKMPGLISYFTKRHSNTKLVRLMMGCYSFAELFPRLQDLEPNYYKPPG